jgi:hypothetical protein
MMLWHLHRRSFSQLLGPGHWLLAAGFWLLVTCYRPLVRTACGELSRVEADSTCYSLLVTCYWSLGIGFRLLEIKPNWKAS